MSVWAILAAAGRGDRLGLDRPKAFAPLNDRPLIAESLERLEASEWIEGIVVAAPPEWEEPCILVAEEVAAGKVAGTVTGGESRSESVRAALAEVPEEATVVLVHDAARPLVTDEVIGRLVTAHLGRLGRSRSRPARSPTRSSASKARRSPSRSIATAS